MATNADGKSATASAGSSAASETALPDPIHLADPTWVDDALRYVTLHIGAGEWETWRALMTTVQANVMLQTMRQHGIYTLMTCAMMPQAAAMRSYDIMLVRGAILIRDSRK